MKIIDKKYKMITTKKIIVGYLAAVMALCLMVPLNALSQGYAGPNKIMLKDSSVVIGGKGCSNCCYLWTPATGLSDPKILHPTAKPTATTTYTLKVTGDNFNISDVSQMTVTVKDGIDGLTVTAKKCCWSKGDSLGLSQFTIVTDPPGLENTVTISPTSVPTNIFVTPVGSFPVTFTAKGPNNTTKTAVVNISGVDPDAQLQFSAGLGQFKPAEIIDYIDKVINAVKMGPCGATGGPSATMSFATGKICCPAAGCIKDFNAYNGTYNYDIGYQCDFPFPGVGIPYVASINLRINVSAGIAVSLGNIKTTCNGVDVCYSVGFTGSIGGGISGTILGGKVVDASLMIIGTITPDPLEYCLPSGDMKCFGNICAKADVVGTVTLLSYITRSVSVNLISQRCWK